MCSHLKFIFGTHDRRWLNVKSISVWWYWSGDALLKQFSVDSQSTLQVLSMCSGFSALTHASVSNTDRIRKNSTGSQYCAEKKMRICSPVAFHLFLSSHSRKRNNGGLIINAQLWRCDNCKTQWDLLSRFTPYDVQLSQRVKAFIPLCVCKHKNKPHHQQKYLIFVDINEIKMKWKRCVCH